MSYAARVAAMWRAARADSRSFSTGQVVGRAIRSIVGPGGAASRDDAVGEWLSGGPDLPAWVRFASGRVGIHQFVRVHRVNGR